MKEITVDTNKTWHEQLTDVLRSRGHSPDEIEKILAHVKQYDLETQHDSIMDSIGSGEIDLAEIVDEALKEE